jgi:hypothetical protein
MGETRGGVGAGADSAHKTFELEQYRALRNEILRAMEDGNQVVSFGLAGTGVILAAGISTKDTLLGFLIFAVLSPGVTALVLSMWFASAERVARASHFLSGIESRVKQPGEPSWESWLRTSTSGRDGGQGHHFWNTEYSGGAIFLFLIVVPLGFSLATGGGAVSAATKATVVPVMMLIVAGFAYTFVGRIRRWRTWLTTSFEDSH